jgi:hypothetical protein
MDCAVKAPLTPEQRAQGRLDSHRRYNQSRKGQRRNRSYEDKHPERKVRWEEARNIMRPGGAP